MNKLIEIYLSSCKLNIQDPHVTLATLPKRGQMYTSSLTAKKTARLPTHAPKNPGIISLCQILSKFEIIMLIILQFTPIMGSHGFSV